MVLLGKKKRKILFQILQRSCSEVCRQLSSLQSQLQKCSTAHNTQDWSICADCYTCKRYRTLQNDMPSQLYDKGWWMRVGIHTNAKWLSWLSLKKRCLFHTCRLFIRYFRVKNKASFTLDTMSHYKLVFTISKMCDLYYLGPINFTPVNIHSLCKLPISGISNNM